MTIATTQLQQVHKQQQLQTEETTEATQTTTSTAKPWTTMASFTLSLICSGIRSAWYVKIIGSQYLLPSLRACLRTSNSYNKPQTLKCNLTKTCEGNKVLKLIAKVQARDLNTYCRKSFVHLRKDSLYSSLLNEWACKFCVLFTHYRSCMFNHVFLLLIGTLEVKGKSIKTFTENDPTYTNLNVRW